MKVPFVCGANDLRLCDIERPHAGARDVVVRVYTVGICWSDLGYIAAGEVGGPSVADPARLAMVSHRFSASEIMQAFDVARCPNQAAKVLVQYHV